MDERTPMRPATHVPASQTRPAQKESSRMPASQALPREQAFRAQRPRKHMGVASNDPDYLPPTGPSLQVREYRSAEARVDAAPTDDGQLHYDRYLFTPKKGKSIFTARRNRQQRYFKAVLVIAALAAIVLAVVWFFFLK